MLSDGEIGILFTNEGEKLSDENKLSFYKAPEAYPCLWETSNLNHRNRELEENALRELSLKFNLLPNGLKLKLHTLRTALVREISKENDGQQSKWKFLLKELST